MAGLASPILLLFVLFPAKVLALFGAKFAGGAPVLAILAIGQFVNVATGSVGWILIMCGYERLMRNIIIVCATATVALNFLLIPLYGVVGAALATATTLALQMLVAAALVWRKLGLVTLPVWYRRSESA
jgi:O-antigen/teichoic acid export membrane protein